MTGGGVDWLEPFQDVDYGYREFLAQVGILVFGRATFEQIQGHEGGWPYECKRGMVVTSTPLTSPPAGVSPWHEGVPPLISHLRGQKADAWVVGGAALQASFLEAGALDQIEIFVIPLLLGSGVPLFAELSGPRPAKLLGTRTLDKGMLHLSYGFGE
ncbi:dihydrofolate reductase family protein [Acetobacteraceae bacterium H6797]|nr:dihydrofolate reductase family protein [Acetobacteraceae bacterium H6797]